MNIEDKPHIGINGSTAQSYIYECANSSVFFVGDAYDVNGSELFLVLCDGLYMRLYDLIYDDRIDRDVPDDTIVAECSWEHKIARVSDSWAALRVESLAGIYAKYTKGFLVRNDAWYKIVCYDADKQSYKLYNIDACHFEWHAKSSEEFEHVALSACHITLFFT